MSEHISASNIQIHRIYLNNTSLSEASDTTKLIFENIIGFQLQNSV